MVVFDYGSWNAVGVKPGIPAIMFDEFSKQMQYWQTSASDKP